MCDTSGVPPLSGQMQQKSLVSQSCGAGLWGGRECVAPSARLSLAAAASRPTERRYAADSRYSTSGRGPGWASAFWVISISNSVLTSDRRAPPSGPSFSGVFPEEKTKRKQTVSRKDGSIVNEKTEIETTFNSYQRWRRRRRS